MTWAGDLIKAQDGDVLIVPIVLARALGLPAAAFLRQAAYLSAVVEQRDGWFFLEQEGPCNPDGRSIFERLGSWQASLGIGPDAQFTIRRQLRNIGLLDETRSGMVHGKLQYKVDSEKYLEFLASCLQPQATDAKPKQTGKSVCSPRDSRLLIPRSHADVYQEDLPSGRTTPTTSQTESPKQMNGGGLSQEEIQEIIAATRHDDLQRGIKRKPGFWLTLPNRLARDGVNEADKYVLLSFRDYLSNKERAALTAAAKECERNVPTSQPNQAARAAMEMVKRARHWNTEQK